MFLKRALLLAGLGACTRGAMPRVLAETVSLAPLRDTSIFEEGPESLSNGAGVYLFSGNTLKGDLRRALVAFDLTAAVPAGAVIRSATLTLHLSRTSRAGPETVTLHRILADWGEGTSNATGEEGRGAPASPGDATWAFSLAGAQRHWANLGGDFAAAPSAAVTVGQIGSYTWSSTPQLVADVQAWLDEPGASHGWIIIGDEGGGASAKRFDAREHPSAIFRPLLAIEYDDVPTEPIVVSISSAAGMPSLSWTPGRPGLLYTVQTRASMTAGQWAPAPGGAWPIAATSWMDPSAGDAGSKFYRILAAQP